MGTEKQRGMGRKTVGLVLLLTAMLAGAYGALNVVHAVSETTTPVGELVKACLPPPVYHSLTVMIEDPGEGTVEQSPVGPNYLDGSSVTLTVTAEEGYYFSNWSGDLTGDTNPVDLVMDAPKTVTAVFEPQYELTIVKDGEGDVTPESGTTYDPGTVVQVTATPLSGWRFDEWSGGVYEEDGEWVVYMGSDKTITAHFVEQFELTLNVNGGDGGEGTMIEGEGVVLESGTTRVLDALDVVELVAVDTEDYGFWQWSFNGVPFAPSFYLGDPRVHSIRVRLRPV